MVGAHEEETTHLFQLRARQKKGLVSWHPYATPYWNNFLPLGLTSQKVHHHPVAPEAADQPFNMWTFRKHFTSKYSFGLHTSLVGILVVDLTKKGMTGSIDLEVKK